MLPDGGLLPPYPLLKPSYDEAAAPPKPRTEHGRANRCYGRLKKYIPASTSALPTIPPTTPARNNSPR